MADDKIKVSRDEVYNPSVDARLKKQDAVSRTQEHYQNQPAAPQAGAPSRRRTSLWYNTVFYMGLFGFWGGLLAWGGGELVFSLTSTPLEESREFWRQAESIRVAQTKGQMSEEDAQAAMDQLFETTQDNPYIKIVFDESLPQAEKDRRIEQMTASDETRAAISQGLFFSVLGTLIALCLASAEAIVLRNAKAALANAAMGAVLGLVGGTVVSLFINRLYHALGGGGSAPLAQQMLARTVGWGVLGAFLSIAPGVVLRNLKKLGIGLAGGMVGGLLGGLLFDPLGRLGIDDTLTRFIGIVAIGTIAGIGTGLIENAAKAGWLKVVAGVITGKQFIVYRNPTYIGSSPQCEIYLFKDPQIAPQHAAVHVVSGGYDIENLGTGTGTGTFVNGRLVGRSRLRHGDQVQIGSTCFVFQEKARSA